MPVLVNSCRGGGDGLDGPFSSWLLPPMLSGVSSWEMLGVTGSISPKADRHCISLLYRAHPRFYSRPMHSLKRPGRRKLEPRHASRQPKVT